MKLPIILLSIFLLSSCAGAYYGYSKIEWEALSDQERADAKASYEQAIVGKQGMLRESILEKNTETLTKRGVEHEG